MRAHIGPGFHLHVDRAQAPSGRPSKLRSRAAFALDTFLGSYSQILFCRSRLVGGLLLLTTAFSPALMLGGAGAVGAAALFVWVLGLDRDMLHSGLYGYNALLLGLGAAALLAHTPLSAALAAVAVLLTVLLTAALHSILDRALGLPVLTLPFLAAFYLLLGTAQVLLLIQGHAVAVDPLQSRITWAPAALYLRSLGSIFFLPRLDAGLVFFLALLAYSRVAVLLSFLAFAVALAVLRPVDAAWDGLLPVVVAFNFILVAVAIGQVWFVPGLASFAFALAALLISGLTTLGLLPVLVRVGLPLLILPFNLTVLALLYAMRQRSRASALQWAGSGTPLASEDGHQENKETTG